MAPLKFDAATRSLPGAPSRRGALRGLAAAVGLATLVPAVVGAKKGKKGKKGPHCDRCPQRVCCQCNNAAGDPVSCQLIDDAAACDPLCTDQAAGNDGISLNPFPGVQAHFCGVGFSANRCVSVSCPVA